MHNILKYNRKERDERTLKVLVLHKSLKICAQKYVKNTITTKYQQITEPWHSTLHTFLFTL